MKVLQLMSTPGKSQHSELLVQSEPGSLSAHDAGAQTSGWLGIDAHRSLEHCELAVHWQPFGRFEPEQGGGSGAQ